MNLGLGRSRLKSLIKNGSLSYMAIIGVCIIIPLHVQYLPPFIILWAIFWLIENSTNGYNIFNDKAVRLLFFLFVLYYAWQFAGLLYTADIKMGLSNLFGRLSLAVFPLLLIFPGAPIRANVKKLLKIFAFSTLIYLLFCFINASFRSLEITGWNFVFNSHPEEAPWLSYFYSAELSVGQHPSYIAMYVLLSSFIFFEAWFNADSVNNKKIIFLLSGIFMIISLYFLSSRAGIISSLILFPVYFIVKLRKNGIRKYVWIWTFLAICCTIPVVLKNQRVDYLFSKILNTKTDYERKDDPRLKIWQSSLRIAKENLILGVGIGDVRASLASEYKRIGEETMAKERLNSHNQFIEVLVENGIIGLIIFLSVFTTMFYIAFSEKNLLYIIFILITIMFFMFETMLYRLAGVSFFGLLSFLLIQDTAIRENKKQ